jgi:hypothetical protein
MKSVYAMRFSCSGDAVEQSQQIVKRIQYPFLLLFRGAGMEFNSTSVFAWYGGAAKKAVAIQDEADGNPQPFREFPFYYASTSLWWRGLLPLRCMFALI